MPIAWVQFGGGHGGYVPPIFHWRDIICHDLPLFLFRFCIWRGFKNKSDFCHVLCEEFFMLGYTKTNSFWNRVSCGITDSVSLYILASLEKFLAFFKFLVERQKHDNWITEEIRDLFEQRRKNKDNETRYCELENLIKQKCIQGHDEFLKRKCAEIEQLFNLNCKVAHMKTREISNKKTYNTPWGCLKGKNGEMLFGEEDIKEIWKEYITELHGNPDRGSQPFNSE